MTDTAKTSYRAYYGRLLARTLNDSYQSPINLHNQFADTIAL